MESGKFYFIKNEYYEKFDRCGLIGNKEIEGATHGRPCFYCFESNGYYWMVPISSRVEKYEALYEEKMNRYHGNFDGIRFGYVNGQKRAFLIQNLCPVTDEYIACKYKINKDSTDVTIDDELAQEINKIVLKVLRLHKKGIRIVLTDLDQIIRGL